MKLTFLGTGDFLPNQSRHNSAYLEWDQTNLFIDFPSTNRDGLRQLGKDLDTVERVFITHLHADHINGLEQLAYYHMIVTKRKPILYIPSTLTSKLWRTLQQGLGITTGGTKQLKDYFEIMEVRDSFCVGNQRFDIIPTEHVPGMDSYGLWASPFFYFSGDSKVDERLLVHHSHEVKTIFHDCHLWDLNIESHASLQEIKQLPPSIQQKMVLMHYHAGYDEENEKILFEKKERLRLARPLQCFEFNK